MGFVSPLDHGITPFGCVIKRAFLIMKPPLGTLTQALGRLPVNYKIDRTLEEWPFTALLLFFRADTFLSSFSFHAGFPRCRAATNLSDASLCRSGC
jgi:hypothetical protein